MAKTFSLSATGWYYYYDATTNERRGPYNSRQLQNFVSTDIIKPDTVIEDDKGMTARAGDVLQFPVPEPVQPQPAPKPEPAPPPTEPLFWFYDKKGVEQGPFNDVQLVVQARNKKLPEGKETIIVNAQKQKTTAGNIPWLAPHISKSFAGAILSYISGGYSYIVNTLFLLVLLAALLAVLGTTAGFLIWNTDPYHLYLNWKYPPLNCNSAETLQESWKQVKKKNIDTLPFDDKKEFRETSYELDRLSESIKKAGIQFAVVQDEIREELDGKRYYNGLKYIVANDLKRKVDKWIEVSNPKIDCTSEETLKDSIEKMINVFGKLDKEQYAEIMDALDQFLKMLYAKEIDYSVQETKSYISQKLDKKTIKEIGKFNPRDIPRPENPIPIVQKPIINFDAKDNYRTDDFRQNVKKMEDALSKDEREKYGDTIDALDRLLSKFDADKNLNFDKVKQGIRKELNLKTFEEINNIGKEKLTSLIDKWLKDAQPFVEGELVEFEPYFRWTGFSNTSDWFRYGTPELKSEYELSRPKTPFEEKDPAVLAKFNSVKDKIKSELDKLKSIQFYEYIDVSGQFRLKIAGPPDGESTCEHSHYDRLLFSPISGKQWDEPPFNNGMRYKYLLSSSPRLTIDAQGPTPIVKELVQSGKNFKFRVIFNNYQSTYFWQGYNRDKYYGIVHHNAAADVLKFETYYPYMDAPEILMERGKHFGRITGMPTPSPTEPVVLKGGRTDFRRYEPIAGLKGMMGSLGLPMTYLDVTGPEYAEYYFSRVMDSLDYKNQVRDTYVLSKRLEKEKFKNVRPIQIVDSTGLPFDGQNIGGRQDDYNKLITAGKDRDWLLMINLLLGNDGRYERVDQRIQNVPRVAGNSIYANFPA